MGLVERALTDEERSKLERLTRAQSAPVRLVRRAGIIWLAAQGLSVSAITQQLGISEKMVRQRVRRFEAAGLDGLEDAPRSGRPHTYPPEVTNQVIAKARSLPPKPAAAGSTEGETPPTCHWTLDRLQAELAKDGVPIKRSQIRRLLRAEHLKWQKPRTWLESDDPEFAAKRGRLFSSTPSRPQRAR
jgi:transposase